MSPTSVPRTEVPQSSFVYGIEPYLPRRSGVSDSAKSAKWGERFGEVGEVG
jgi:hypothetical protein